MRKCTTGVIRNPTKDHKTKLGNYVPYPTGVGVVKYHEKKYASVYGVHSHMMKRDIEFRDLFTQGTSIIQDMKKCNTSSK